LSGEGFFDDRKEKTYSKEDLLLYGVGEEGEIGKEVRIQSESPGLRFLLISGRPLREPVAWYGPIVMNTDEELQLAFQEYREGTFIKDDG
jgi:redox-sensitive bicupin YhaK (pirin superfamily)